MMKSWRMRWAWHVTHVAEKSTYNILVRKPEGKTPAGRFKQRQVDTKKDLGARGCKIRTRFIWFRTETSGKLLLT
jgi:hypothetical protein